MQNLAMCESFCPKPTPSQDTCSRLGMSKNQLGESTSLSLVSRPAAPKTYPVVSPLVIPLATPEQGCL